MYYDEVILYEDYERAAKNGVSRYALDNRVKYLMWDKEKAITTPVRRAAYCKKVLNLANSNGISRSTLSARILISKMTPYEAATKPIMTNSECLKKAQRKLSENRKLRKENRY